MPQDRDLISKQVHELNYLLHKWGKRQTKANRAALIDALDAFGAEVGEPVEHERQAFYAYAERTQLAATLEDRRPKKASAAQPKSTPSASTSGDLAERVDAVLAKLGVTGLQVEIDEAEIEAMRAGGVEVDFPAAVEAALSCFIEDGSLCESPVWIVNELALDFDLSEPPSEAAVQAKVRELLATPGCWLRLYAEPEAPNDEWVGVAMCDEDGERYGTSAHWIFTLEPSPFTDHNTAVVHKQTGARVCWGFS
jgi:hypothetical protein